MKNIKNNQIKQSFTLNNTKGISQNLACELLVKNGKNKLNEQNKVSGFTIFANQYKDILTIILLISTLISVFLGEFIDAIVIGIIVLMNGVMGFIQEFKTEKTLESLKKLSAPTAKVYRDNILKTIPSEDVVEGDLVLVEEGDQICADGVVVESSQLSSNESILTGEVNSIKKEIFIRGELKENQLNQKDMLYMGTTITSGHGKMVVVYTGMSTQMGQIASMIEEIEPEQTPLQKKLAKLGKYIAFMCLVICALVSVIGFMGGGDIFDMLLIGISLAVAAIPEGLPAIVTIALALSVSRLVKQNALVRKLTSVETLGCVNVICSDKTGTLTENKMSVSSIFCNNKPSSFPIQCKHMSTEYITLLCGALCNTVNFNNTDKTLIGEPTEVALVKVLEKTNISFLQIKSDYTILKEKPFSSETRYMWVVAQNISGEKIMLVKGAIDVILSKCNLVEVNQEEEILSLAERKKIMARNDEMASNGLRVLGFAYKKIPSVSSGDYSEDNLVFLGLIGMQDPPRREVFKAIKDCQVAGIKPVMITGDHLLTAKSIGSKIGLYKKSDLLLTGQDLGHMNKKDLNQVIDKVSIFARVSPKDKLRIVSAFQENGNIVAMTGDGVNDAPAIKKADIGVAMGITGTDVTKQASDIVLLDDNFATLVNSVVEGRGVYANIRRFIRYLLSCNIGEVLTMLMGMLMGLPVILLPIQILLINLVTDGLPAIALGIEPKEESLLYQKPRKSTDGIFSGGLVEKILFRGALIGVCTVGAFVSLLKFSGDEDIARTGAYFTLIVTQLFNVFECKSEDKNIFRINFLNNKALIFSVLGSIIVLFASIYITPLQLLLNTVSLKGEHLMRIAFYCILPTSISTIMHLKIFTKSRKK